MKTDSVLSKLCSPEIQVGDKVVIRSGTYNRQGDNLGHMHAIVTSISGKRAGVRLEEREKYEPRLQLLLLEDLIPDKLAGTFFEYRCAKKKCGRAFWVKGIGPVDGMWLFGSDADLCEVCGKLANHKRTGMVRIDGVIQRGEGVDTCIEEHTTTKTYDVSVSTWCGGHAFNLREVGSDDSSGPNPYEGLTKLRGEGGRVRITMKVEVLRSGKRVRSFHPTGCHACGTKGAKNMHILQYGKPFCRFSNEVPAEWPRGHWWVGLNGRDVRRVNCRKCLQRAAPQCHDVLRGIVEETLKGLKRKRRARRPAQAR